MNTPDNDQTEAHFQKELLLVQIEIQEHGLEMVRQEVYENVGQVLSLVKLYLSEHFPMKPRQRKNSLVLSKKLVGQAIRDLRLAVKPVSITEINEKGIVVAIQHELETLYRVHNRPADFKVSKKIFRFDVEKEVIVFRILQELISVLIGLDAHRPLALQASFDPKEVTFTISYRTGSNVSTVAGHEQEDHPGNYISNARKMQVRAGLIDAELAFSGSPGGDLAILLRLPMPK